MLWNRILAIRDAWNKRWEALKSHPPIAAILFIIGVPWAIHSAIKGEAPWVVVVWWWTELRPHMTAANLTTFAIFLSAAVSGIALVVGYYEQRVRSLERDRDCNVLNSHLDELRLRFQVIEFERDGLRAKVIELQQEQHSHPSQMEHLRAELHEVMKEHANCEFEKLVLIAEKNEWGNIDVLIRFIEYADNKLADELLGYIREHAPKWAVELEQVSGSKIRPTMERSRVEVAAAKNTHLSGTLSSCLARSGRVNGRVHHVNGDPDGPYCVVTIFPKPNEANRG